jgi:co-chaperonin GroES (HSP10)
MSQILTTHINKLHALHDSVLVTEMSFEERRSAAGIVIPVDDGKSSGVRPRWGKVFAVGPKQQHVKEGQWILVDHGRWTRGIKISIDQTEHVIRKVDNNDILLVTDTQPMDETFSDKV